MSWPWVALILSGGVAGAVLGTALWLVYRKSKDSDNKEND